VALIIIAWGATTALEITEAKGMIARFDGFEQLAAVYLAGQPASAANRADVTSAAPAKRLETAVAAWQVQVHRTLAGNPDPADLVRVARVQALISSTTGILTEAAARTGDIDPDIVQRLAPALEGNHVAWSRAVKRWDELTSPASRTDPRSSRQLANSAPRSRRPPPTKPDGPHPNSSLTASTYPGR
jgi:hypothetical protein